VWICDKDAKDSICSMRNKDGEEQTDAQDVANVFATFYETLYKCEKTKYKPAERSRSPPTITAEEIRTQLQHMSAGKAADENGLVGELLKHGSAEFSRRNCKYIQ